MEKHIRIKEEINDFIKNYNGSEKITLSLISSQSNISFNYVSKLADKELIKEKNKDYIPQYKINKLIYRKSDECKNKKKKWREENPNYFKEYRNKLKETILEKRRNELYSKIDVKGIKWIKLNNNENYIVSSGGHIINLKKMYLMSCTVGCDGYITVHLNGKNKMHHRIIAECFIPNPDNKPEVNHKNGIRNDNRIENLEWCTRAENVQHSFKELGRKSNLIGNKGKRKYPTEKIIEELKNKIDYSILKEKYGVTSNYLSNLIHINNLERYMKN